MLLTRAEELFVYDGVNLLWKVNKARAKKGDLAGYITAQGYRTVRADGKMYGVHRLIWLMVKGHMPDCEVDHINGIRLDNRICNLRSVSWSDNGKNKRMLKNNTSGCIGVSQYGDRWQAYINADAKRISLGVFHLKDDAIKARKKAEEYYNYHDNHGRVA